MYIELHARSAFTFLEGAAVPEDLAGACARFQMPAMAIVDRNGVYGAPRFHMAAKKAPIKQNDGPKLRLKSERSTSKLPSADFEKPWGGWGAVSKILIDEWKMQYDKASKKGDLSNVQSQTY